MIFQSGNITLDVTKVDGKYLYINGYFIEPKTFVSVFNELAAAQTAVADQSGLNVFIKDNTTLISSI